MPTITARDGTELYYEIDGEGPPLVLVHGITESCRTWDPLRPRLEEDHLVVAVDLRGHGSSARRAPHDLATFAADVQEIVSAAGIGDDVVLVGHSLGGTVVTAYAAAFTCRSVVNVDQPLALAEFQSGLQQLAPMLRGDGAAFSQAITAVFDAMRGPLPDDEVARVDAIRDADQDVVLGVWSPIIDGSPGELDALVTQIASTITVPYLSLHGIDPGKGYADWLRGLIPTATVEVWPDHGHYPHLVDPERFLARLAGWTTGY